MYLNILLFIKFWRCELYIYQIVYIYNIITIYFLNKAIRLSDNMYNDRVFYDLITTTTAIKPSTNSSDPTYSSSIRQKERTSYYHLIILKSQGAKLM